MSRTIVTSLLSIALLTTTSIATAASADERAQAAAETRQGLLKVVANYFGPIYAMARQQMPYDGELVKANAEKIATLLPMIPDVFRADTRAYDLETEALDDIWDNTDDFNAKAAAAAEKATALAAATAAGQEATMEAFGAMGGSCKACHDNYRQQN